VGKGTNITNILGGFRGSGIWPLDPAAAHSHHLINDNGSSTSGIISGDISNFEPWPGCSSNSNEIVSTSEVIQVIRELLKPEENTTEHTKRDTSTRCVTCHELLKEMKEKGKNKSKRSKVQESSSDSSESEKWSSR
jgi:hypothetical protein